jgi:hypothetical protein
LQTRKEPERLNDGTRVEKPVMAREKGSRGLDQRQEQLRRDGTNKPMRQKKRELAKSSKTSNAEDREEACDERCAERRL